MSNDKLNKALFDKMSAEQEQYRDWLLSQPPEEILRHTYEYTVRQDILLAFENNDLTDEQATALLASDSPLADVFNAFEKLETDYMATLWDCMEERADTLAKQQEREQPDIVYPHNKDHAVQHGEMKIYSVSLDKNIACKEAIEQAVDDAYHDNRLDTKAALAEVLQNFHENRVAYVLAVSIKDKEFDGRISPENKAWAKTIPTAKDRNNSYFVVDKCHVGLLDLFAKRFRDNQKSSVLDKLREPGTKVTAPSTKIKSKQEVL